MKSVDFGAWLIDNGYRNGKEPSEKAIKYGFAQMFKGITSDNFEYIRNKWHSDKIIDAYKNNHKIDHFNPEDRDLKEFLTLF